MAFSHNTPTPTRFSDTSMKLLNKGKWTDEEHAEFMKRHELAEKNNDPDPYGYIETCMPTRTRSQIKTHAQKYRAAQKKGMPFPAQVGCMLLCLIVCSHTFCVLR